MNIVCAGANCYCVENNIEKNKIINSSTDFTTTIENNTEQSKKKHDSSDLIKKNHEPIEQQDQLQHYDIEYYKNENSMLKAKLDLLSKDFENMKINYNNALKKYDSSGIELARNKYRDELKEFYYNQEKPSTIMVDFISPKYSSESNINILYKFRNDIKTSVKHCNVPFAVNYNTVFDKPYYKNFDMCNSIMESQDYFVYILQNKINKLEYQKKYLYKLLEKLPSWDSNNTEVRKQIISYINNYLIPITEKVLKFQKIQKDMNLQENLVKIDEYVLSIQKELNQIINKSENKTYDAEMTDLYNDFRVLIKEYNKIFNSEFFINL